MLIFTVKVGEAVYINLGEVVIKVLGGGTSQVKLGFIADQSISIDREKIHRLKQLKNASESNVIEMS